MYRPDFSQYYEDRYEYPYNIKPSEIHYAKQLAKPITSRISQGIKYALPILEPLAYSAILTTPAFYGYKKYHSEKKRKRNCSNKRRSYEKRR